MTTPRAAVHLQSFHLAHNFLMRAFETAYTDEQLTRTTSGSRSHVLWLLGHLVWAYDTGLDMGPGRASQMPASYHDLFAFSTKPSNNVADYPSLHELKQNADIAFKRLSGYMADLTDAGLDAPVPAGHPVSANFASIDQFLGFLSFHTGYHLGQISLLRLSGGLPGLVGF